MSLAESKNTISTARQRWTAEEDERLKRLVSAGSSWNSILEKMPGRKKAAIYSHFQVSPDL